MATAAHILRYRTTEAFLASGTPLVRLPYFRDLIEKGTASLTDATELAGMYIPKIEAEQLSVLKDELLGETIGIQFDGSSRLGEVIVCVASYCTSSFELKKRLIMCKTTLKHVKGRELAALITQLLCTTLEVEAANVIAISRDSASVNGSACKRLAQNPFFNVQQMLCICHTLNNAGDHVNFDVLSQWMTPWLELVGGRGAHRGAQSLWKETVYPTVVPGFSKTRWYSKAEIQFVLAEHFDKIPDFLDELDELDYGDATRKALRNVFEGNRSRLQLQLAGMLDLKRLVEETYSLEGDRLEILLVYRRLEALRQLGQSIKHCDDGCLPNVQAVLRSEFKLQPGVEIRKDFPPHGTFSGYIISSSKVNSTLYPGKEVTAYKVRYPDDGTQEDLEEEELRPLLKTFHLPAFKEVCDSVYKAFEYLDNRLTGTCEDTYSCEDMYEACRIFQAFDPSFASNLTSEWLDDLFKVYFINNLCATKPNSRRRFPNTKRSRLSGLSITQMWTCSPSKCWTFGGNPQES